MRLNLRHTEKESDTYILRQTEYIASMRFTERWLVLRFCIFMESKIGTISISHIVFLASEVFCFPRFEIGTNFTCKV